MKNSIFALVLILTTFSACSQDLKCESYHQGVYKIVSDISGTDLIIRTESHQIEENKDLNHTAIFDLDWKDSCTYQLRNRILIRGIDEFEVDEEEILTVQILETYNDYIVVRCSSSVSDYVDDVKMKVICSNAQ